MGDFLQGKSAILVKNQHRTNESVLVLGEGFDPTDYLGCRGIGQSLRVLDEAVLWFLMERVLYPKVL
jgi:hypothetical protein